MVKKADNVEVVVISVDREKKRIALGMKQLQENPWDKAIPEKYAVGKQVQGKITKLVSFGAFVELESSLEGLLHISKVGDQGEGAPPSLQVGDTVEVEVIKLEPADGKIGLSLVRVLEKAAGAKTPPPAGPEPAAGT